MALLLSTSPASDDPTPRDLRKAVLVRRHVKKQTDAALEEFCTRVNMLLLTTPAASDASSATKKNGPEEEEEEEQQKRKAKPPPDT